jgi:hypothetical protein
MEHVMMIDHVEGAETWEYPIAKMQSRAGASAKNSPFGQQFFCLSSILCHHPRL